MEKFTDFYRHLRGSSLIRASYFCFLMLLLLAAKSQAQVTLTMTIAEKNGLTTIKAGEVYTLQLNYSVSSTTGNANGVKAIVNLPTNIFDVRNFAGTTHAPAANFVYNSTAHTLTINFIDPVPSGSNGVLEFAVVSNNLITPNGTVLTTTATLEDGASNTSGVQTQAITVTAAARLCPVKSFVSGGSVGNNTTYRILVSYNSSLFTGYMPVGMLEATNITVTDNLPAGATFVSAVINSSAGGPAGAGTESGGVVTCVVPNLTGFYNGDWNANFATIDITVKYDSPTFNNGDIVTNNATVTYTPFGTSPITLNNGDNGNSGGSCILDLTEVTTLAAPNINVTLGKGGDAQNIYPGNSITYTLYFNNLSNLDF